jgi:hypothetical protein
MLDEGEEAFVVGRVAEADGGDGRREVVVEEPLDAGVFAQVGEGMVEAAAAGEVEAAGGEGLAEGVFALGREEHERLAVLTGGSEPGVFGGAIDAGGEFIEGHVSEGSDGGVRFGGGGAKGGEDSGSGAAENVGRGVGEDDGAAVFDDAGVGKAHAFVPEFDFGAGFGGGEDDGGLDGAEAGEGGERGCEGIGMVVEEAVVEVGEDNEHDSTMAGHR